MKKMKIILAAAAALMVLASCQEGPLADITVHEGGSPEPQPEVTAFSKAVTGGVVDGDKWKTVPKLLFEFDGENLPADVYMSYSVDDGPAVVKGPLKKGEPYSYDINEKVYPAGTHTIKGKLYCNGKDGAEVVLKTFEDTFVVESAEQPQPVEPDYVVSVVKDGVETPLKESEVATIAASSAYTLKIDFKGKGSGKVTVRNIDYTFSLLDFDMARKSEGEGLATVPMTTKKAGTAFVTITFARGDKIWKPTYQLTIQ